MKGYKPKLKIEFYTETEATVSDENYQQSKDILGVDRFYRIIRKYIKSIGGTVSGIRGCGLDMFKAVQ